ncbi:MAG: hypothetical protein FWG30_11435, partial [Eubacteriaceae bacterium]|nr:hypothetical protein [Eubacteriaceae bacterium]
EAPASNQAPALAKAVGAGHINRDFFEGPGGDSYKAKYKIPEGYKAYCACYFGYRDESQPERDRGPRREGTVTVF